MRMKVRGWMMGEEKSSLGREGELFIYVVGSLIP
jgi:hypothetical protein